MEESCPCGSGNELESCCGPIIDGSGQPATAEALMRARYTAYVTKNITFLFDSLHPTAQEDHDEDAVRQWADSAQWHGLEILSHEAGGENDAEGYVEFAAIYEDKRGWHRHHERSRFERVDGDWRFVEGEVFNLQPYVNEEPKIGRNEPCPCGSGKKYKKCCGR